MPGLLTTELGKISITEDIIANIAGMAAGENYGISGMSAKTAGDALLKLVGSGDNYKRGVRVTVTNDGTAAEIDIYVTLVYGVSLPAVSQNMIRNVRYRVEEMTGIKVNNVNIHVESITVPS